MSNSYERYSCRFCGNNTLATVLDLGSSPLCDEYSGERTVSEYFPLKLKLCNSCMSVQTSEVVASDFIYTNYIYFTHTSPGLDSHFEQYAVAVKSILGKSEGLVVDVGSNDGCLLSHFRAQGFDVIGVEPSSAACDYSLRERGVASINSYFNDAVVKDILHRFGGATVITFNNVFANIDCLEQVVELSAELLSKNGLIVIESSYLYDMLDNLVFDFIYHEHLSYISLRPLQALFGRYGFKVFHVDRVGTKGGSVRYFISRSESSLFSVSQDFTELIQREENLGDLTHLFSHFARRIELSRVKFIDILRAVRSEGKIFGYGASATTTTLLHAWKMGELFHGLFDDNLYKHNTYSPGYGLLVSDYSDSILSSNDTIIIMAWRFRNEILKRIDDFEGNVIIPLPEPILVQKSARS